MDRSSKTNAGEYYDKLSASYDELYGEEQLRKHDKVVEFLGNRRFGIIVDIGCGTGNLLEKLGERCEAAVGIDVSSQMLLMAKTRLGRERVELVRADFKALPVRSSIMDCALAISLLDSRHDDYKAQMSEIRRIATQQGTLAFTVFHPDDEDLKIEQFALPPRASVEKISKRENLYVIQPTNTPGNGPSKAGLSHLL